MAGKVTVNEIQLGDSGTASQNAVLKTNVDGTFTLARGNSGAEIEDLLTIDADSLVTLLKTNNLKTETAIATTSGTSHDFTSIPSWVKRITVILNSVSTNGTSKRMLQIGDSGGIETSGYTGSNSQVGGGAATQQTGGAGVEIYHGGATVSTSGQFVLTLVQGNEWVITFSGGAEDTPLTFISGGRKSLSGTLDRIRLTTVNGTDTFDAGSINIMYEG